MKNIRRLPILLVLCAAMAALPWVYTKTVLTIAHSRGVYSSPEEGMLALADQQYPPDHSVKIYYAGPNDSDGLNPYVWYVIAEVHASARADGSAMGRNGCDNPGSFFLQLRDGSWVHVGEGLFTTFMAPWMGVFNMAGEGISKPSVNLINGPMRFCR